MHYTGTIWRPPYEAASLLLEVTAGCTHHKCKFCTLYNDLPFKFRMSPLEDIESDLREVKRATKGWNSGRTRRVFLTGANPFVLSYDKPSNYEMSKTRKYKNDIGRIENMDYDEASDACTCRNGKQPSFAYVCRSKSKTGNVSEKSIYQCRESERLPLQKNCSKGNHCETPMEECNKELSVAKTSCKDLNWKRKNKKLFEAAICDLRKCLRLTH